LKTFKPTLRPRWRSAAGMICLRGIFDTDFLMRQSLGAPRGSLPAGGWLDESASGRPSRDSFFSRERAMYQVKDAMNRNVISIGPEATVEEAIHLLLDHSISGAPVIDDEGELCGIITQFQLLEVMYDPNVKNTRIRDCMTRGVFTIDEDALLG